MQHSLIEGAQSQYLKGDSNNLNFEEVQFYPFGGNTTNAIPESALTMKLTYAFFLVRVQINIGTNTRTGPITFGFRDDGVTVASIDIPTGQTGRFQNTFTDVKVEAESEIVGSVDGTLGGSGQIRFDFIYWEYKEN